MNSSYRIPLNTSPSQLARLVALQEVFAQVCNALTPTVLEHKCWNRVALHHMAYKSLRERFPDIGSQMVCNAIYSVCRVARMVYQGESSPFNVGRMGDRPLPLLRFGADCPVYFDRHTLSLKGGCLSMYTLDGRMRFQLLLQPEAEQAFQTQKLREIVLSRRQGGHFEIAFWLDSKSDEATMQQIDALSTPNCASAEVEMNPGSAAAMSASISIPNYISLEAR